MSIENKNPLHPINFGSPQPAAAPKAEGQKAAPPGAALAVTPEPPMPPPPPGFKEIATSKVEIAASDEAPTSEEELQLSPQPPKNGKYGEISGGRITLKSELLTSRDYFTDNEATEEAAISSREEAQKKLLSSEADDSGKVAGGKEMSQQEKDDAMLEASRKMANLSPTVGVSISDKVEIAASDEAPTSEEELQLSPQPPKNGKYGEISGGRITLKSELLTSRDYFTDNEATEEAAISSREEAQKKLLSSEADDSGKVAGGKEMSQQEKDDAMLEASRKMANLSPTVGVSISELEEQRKERIAEARNFATDEGTKARQARLKEALGESYHKPGGQESNREGRLALAKARFNAFNESLTASAATYKSDVSENVRQRTHERTIQGSGFLSRVGEAIKANPGRFVLGLAVAAGVIALSVMSFGAALPLWGIIMIKGSVGLLGASLLFALTLNANKTSFKRAPPIQEKLNTLQAIGAFRNKINNIEDRSGLRDVALDLKKIINKEAAISNATEVSSMVRLKKLLDQANKFIGETRKDYNENMPATDSDRETLNQILDGVLFEQVNLCETEDGENMALESLNLANTNDMLSKLKILETNMILFFNTESPGKAPIYLTPKVIDVNSSGGIIIEWPDPDDPDEPFTKTVQMSDLYTLRREAFEPEVEEASTIEETVPSAIDAFDENGFTTLFKTIDKVCVELREVPGHNWNANPEDMIKVAEKHFKPIAKLIKQGADPNLLMTNAGIKRERSTALKAIEAEIAFYEKAEKMHTDDKSKRFDRAQVEALKMIKTILETGEIPTIPKHLRGKQAGAAPDASEQQAESLSTEAGLTPETNVQESPAAPKLANFAHLNRPAPTKENINTIYKGMSDGKLQEQTELAIFIETNKAGLTQNDVVKVQDLLNLGASPNITVTVDGDKTTPKEMLEKRLKEYMHPDSLPAAKEIYKRMGGDPNSIKPAPTTSAKPPTATPQTAPELPSIAKGKSQVDALAKSMEERRARIAERSKEAENLMGALAAAAEEAPAVAPEKPVPPLKTELAVDETVARLKAQQDAAVKKLKEGQGPKI